jgi:hypothetical protein
MLGYVWGGRLPHELRGDGRPTLDDLAAMQSVVQVVTEAEGRHRK